MVRTVHEDQKQRQTKRNKKVFQLCLDFFQGSHENVFNEEVNDISQDGDSNPKNRPCNKNNAHRNGGKQVGKKENNSEGQGDDSIRIKRNTHETSAG